MLGKIYMFKEKEVKKNIYKFVALIWIDIIQVKRVVNLLDTESSTMCQN